MEKTNEKKLIYIAAALFLLPLLRTGFIYSPLSFLFSEGGYFWVKNYLPIADHFWGELYCWREWSPLFGLCCIVLAVGAGIKNKHLLAAGVFLNLINQIQTVLVAIGYFFVILNAEATFKVKLTAFLYPCSRLLIFLALVCVLFSFLGMGGAESIKEKFSVLFRKFPLENMHVYSIILVAMSTFLCLIDKIVWGGDYFFKDALSYAATFGAATIIGYVEYGKDKLAWSGKAAKTYAASCGTPNSSSVDRLIKLKELLDSGIITQKEFDEKKKQILRM